MSSSRRRSSRPGLSGGALIELVDPRQETAKIQRPTIPQEKVIRTPHEHRESRFPELPESVSEATVGEWHVAAGDSVDRDENVVDLETDKVMLEVPATAAGDDQGNPC